MYCILHVVIYMYISVCYMWFILVSHASLETIQMNYYNQCLHFSDTIIFLSIERSKE